MSYEKSIELFKKLSEPFPQEEVKIKIQAYNKEKTKGMIVAYVDARTVQDRLNSVLGVFGWGDSYEDLVSSDDKWTSRCTITIYDENGRGVSRSDVGTGSAKSGDDENVEKGAHSDAFKRACVPFGIGRELYSYPRAWVELTGEGKYKKIADEKGARAKMFGGQSKGKGSGKEREQPSSPPRSPEGEKNGGGGEKKDESQVSMATESQKKYIKGLVERALSGDWGKISKRLCERENYKKALESGADEEHATLGSLTAEEAKTIIDQLKKHEERIKGENKE